MQKINKKYNTLKPNQKTPSTECKTLLKNIMHNWPPLYLFSQIIPPCPHDHQLQDDHHFYQTRLLRWYQLWKKVQIDQIMQSQSKKFRSDAYTEKMLNKSIKAAKSIFIQMAQLLSFQKSTTMYDIFHRIPISFAVFPDYQSTHDGTWRSWRFTTTK